ncbi:hypothetical protein Hbl1158_05720 [Halobaculum sp. CBA1158]|uniref:DUF7315 family membrane protein n=1 Tax=Halobaculum sp. CBA1158 TaxID=2904243 RepID=UPI001F48D6E7|nr:hypothetical protein [Halobaculum sp. CBA1158]UIP00854.1 hypothetical protein Hbl1158_05720 [Halobaculum sp. CBA1158]
MSDAPTDRSGSPADDDSAREASTAVSSRTNDGDAPTGDASAESVDARASGSGRARDVVVPIAVYKRVTAYSTLFAVLTVVLGFVLLDAATLQVSLTRRFVVGAFGLVGIVPAETLLTALFSVLGIASIVLGAGVYVLGSRFRAAGMEAENGNSQDDDPEV